MLLTQDNLGLINSSRDLSRNLTIGNTNHIQTLIIGTDAPDTGVSTGDMVKLPLLIFFYPY